MPCYTDECNQAPFELSDPTLIYPERSPRGAAPQSSPSRPNLGNFSYLLCFDNDPFCLPRNPFLLITIWIAYAWKRSSGASLPSLFATLCKEQNASPFFSTACALFAQNTRVYPDCSRLGTRTSAPAPGTQAASIRHLKIPPIPTTVCPHKPVRLAVPTRSFCCSLSLGGSWDDSCCFAVRGSRRALALASLRRS